jgi:putative ABC transport system permease protein
VLVAGEVAAAVVLLATATLFMRTLVNLRSVEPGFDTSRLLLMEMALPGNAFASTGNVAAFYERVIQRLTASPGVVSAGAAERVPVEGSRLNPNRTIDIEGRPAVNGETRAVDDITVTAGYLETLGVRLREGRRFTNADGPTAPLVAVISETTARRFWGRASPVGSRLRLGDEPSPDDWRTVIGVVADVRNDDVDQPPPPHVYVPATQRLSREMVFMMRVSDDPLAHVAAARAAVAAEDADLPLYDVQSMDDLLREDLQGSAVLASMTTTFGVLALLLAAVGIYGMVAYTVAQRTREIAIRVAVGAQMRDVMRNVLGRGLRAVVMGLLIGLAGAMALAQVMTVVLYRVSPTDPVTYAFTAAVLLGAAALACLVPAHRALRLDPVVALRAD